MTAPIGPDRRQDFAGASLTMLLFPRVDIPILMVQYKVLLKGLLTLRPDDEGNAYFSTERGTAADGERTDWKSVRREAVAAVTCGILSAADLLLIRLLPALNPELMLASPLSDGLPRGLTGVCGKAGKALKAVQKADNYIKFYEESTTTKWKGDKNEVALD